LNEYLTLLQDVEVERVLDVAARSSLTGLRQVKVDDHPVAAIVRIDFAVRDADDLFVLPDAGKRVAAKGEHPVCYFDVGNARLHRRGKSRGDGGRE
jgi:hypothetical protein